MMTIKFSSIIYQLLQRKIAFAMSSYNGDDVYYQKDIIDITLNVIGEDNFIDMLKRDESPNKKTLNKIGDDWNKPNGMKNKLKKMQKIIENTKISYDLLEDKTLSKRNKPNYLSTKENTTSSISTTSNNHNVNFKSFSSKAKFIPQIKTELSSLIVFILTNSEFNNKTIAPQHMKILESGGKVGKLDGDEYEE